ncbi:MAG TPA: ATP-binding cassette domain-containing protein, partial [Pyrinomonadaceae bacterium]|nr:ATP-binding cassette domain-containing protein [Pyrinomonadaceae bacterium]
CLNRQDVTLALTGVSKSFNEFAAVTDLSLQARRGRIFGLLGPNGAGKTTTIRMIVGITAPDAGRVEFLGQPMSPALRDRIGYLPEERGLYRKMKIGEQLRFFAELKGMSGQRAEREIDRWLERMKLTEWKLKKTDELSKGMQQKVQFIAAVLHDPDLLILDEPFSGLDPMSVETLNRAVLDLQAAGKTIILSTHLMEQAEKLCADICLINRAHRVLGGSLREIKQSYGRNTIALRVEGANGVLADATLVAGSRQHSDYAEVLLADGADAQELLRRLVETGAHVSKFEQVEPSLNDIFIERVNATS